MLTYFIRAAIKITLFTLCITSYPAATVMAKSKISHVGASAQQVLGQRDTFSQVLTTIGIAHEPTIAGINEACQKNLIRPTGLERPDFYLESDELQEALKKRGVSEENIKKGVAYVEHAKEWEKHRAELMPLFEQINLTDTIDVNMQELVALYQQHPTTIHIFVHGGTAERMKSRLDAAQDLVNLLTHMGTMSADDEIFTFKKDQIKLVLLAGSRKLNLLGDILEGETEPRGTTELDAIESLFKESAIADMSHVFINAQAAAGQTRPDTAATIEAFLTQADTADKHGIYISVSNQPFALRQALVIVDKVLGKDITVIACGKAASDEAHIATDLDEAARLWYQAKTIQEKEAKLSAKPVEKAPVGKSSEEKAEKKS